MTDIDRLILKYDAEEFWCLVFKEKMENNEAPAPGGISNISRWHYHRGAMDAYAFALRQQGYHLIPRYIHPKTPII